MVFSKMTCMQVQYTELYCIYTVNISSEIQYIFILEQNNKINIEVDKSQTKC